MKSKNILSVLAAVMALTFLSGCTETRYAAHVIKQIPVPGERSPSKGYFKVGAPYTIKGKRYKPVERYTFVQEGIASWYGPGFHGKLTANGEIFDENELTAAHKTLQLPSIIKVTNLDNGRTIILRVNDRGPYAHDRILDVSKRGAVALGFKNAGMARIRMEVLGEPSREIANLARTGKDTGGYEIALNQNKNQYSSLANKAMKPTAKPEPVTQLAMSNENYNVYPNNKPNYPVTSQTAVVKNPLPVEAEPLTSITGTSPMNDGYIAKTNVNGVKTGKIFVQAGSFAEERNALSFSDKMSNYGQSKVYLTRINNQPYFRVRLGPYDDRMQATKALVALNESGNSNAVIVVD